MLTNGWQKYFKVRLPSRIHFVIAVQCQFIGNIGRKVLAKITHFVLFSSIIDISQMNQNLILLRAAL